MGVILIPFIAISVGAVLILLIGRGTPVHPASLLPGAGAGGELAWMRGFGIEGFQRLAVLLFAEMGFSLERSNRSADVIDLLVVDATPIKGSRIAVHGMWSPPLGLVGSEDVRATLEATRGESAGKSVLLTLGSFSPDARAEAQGAPIDLVDGEALGKLVKKYLPQIYAQKKV